MTFDSALGADNREAVEKNLNSALDREETQLHRLADLIDELPFERERLRLETPWT